MLDPKGRQDITQTENDINQTETKSWVTITDDLNENVEAERTLTMDEEKAESDTPRRKLFEKEAELQEIGLDVPFIAKLANQLRKKTITFSKQPLNQKELLEELWTYHLNK